MSDPKKIKEQTTINSGDVTPEEAVNDLEEVKEEELGEISGGMSKNVSYSDWVKQRGIG